MSDECRYNRYGPVVPDFGQHNKTGMTFYEGDDKGVFRALSGGLSLTGIVCGIDLNPFPLSDDVLVLRTTLPLLRHCCSSFFNAPRVCIKSVL